MFLDFFLEVVEEKMGLTGTLSLASRPFNELSGGEQQRIIIAMALAQEAGDRSVTGDQRLYNAVKNHLPWVLWIGDHAP